MKKSPDEALNCLLVHPKFSAFSFWNFEKACRAIGARTPSPPLGLITVAAILPQNWSFRLVDMNAEALTDELWAWADIVCTGGMLPQQKGIIELIRRAKKDGKFIAVGGPDPSSQRELYAEADVLSIGEGEDVIPRWLDAWRAGEPRGVFVEREKPDVSKSPLPRYDLLNFKHYAQVGVQYSRGCPFNCEFCDIIELYGRKPRMKSPGQLLKELDRIFELGYTGPIDIVDDNFIGNKRNVKQYLLPAMVKWNRKRRYPFFYNTEASMNLGDDVELMKLMHEADFRNVFMGIETPDPDLLLKTQKSQNTMRPIRDRIARCYEHGLSISAGFIMGFDGEKKGMDRVMVQLIEDCDINMAMVGMLVALPNTQLSRRLMREKRLLSFSGKVIESEAELKAGASMEGSVFEIVDQTIAGLNFVTTRDRSEILDEYCNVVDTVYTAKSYFDRILRVCRRLKGQSLHWPRWFELKRSLRGLASISWQLTKRKDTRWLYWRNFFATLARGPMVFEYNMRLAAMFIHFHDQKTYLLQTMEKFRDFQKGLPQKVETPAQPLTAEATA